MKLVNRCVLLLAIAAIVLLLGGGTAHASILGQLVTMDGKMDTIQDNSVAYVVDKQQSPDPGYGILSPGDLVVGVVKLNVNLTHNIDYSAIGEVIVVFAAKINTAVHVPLQYVPPYITWDLVNFTLVPEPGALAALLPAFSIDANDVFALLVDPLPSAGDVTQMTVANAFATLNSGAYQLEARGTLQSLNPWGSSDSFEVQLYDMNKDGMISMTEYVGLSPFKTIGSETAGATYTWLPPSVVPAGSVPLDPVVSGGTTWHDVTLEATLQVPNSTQIANGWMFSDQSYVKTNLIPEPASVVCWLCLGGLALAGYAVRRRKPVA